MFLQNKFAKLLPFILLSTMTVDCSESKFKGGTSAAAPAAADAAPEVGPETPEIEAPVSTPDPATTAEVPCDKANVLKDAFPEEISSCYESGRVFNFDSNECVQMKSAKFTCDFNTVISELRKIGLASPDVEAAATKATSILIGCGQSEDSQRIVVQWINVPEGNGCKNITPGLTVTGCFTNFGTKTPPPPPTSKEERDSRTYACMNEL